MSNTNTGGPAFPVSSDNYASPDSTGMTLREYAAIKLKVPDSGTAWLDEMITKSLKNDFAARALPEALVELWSQGEHTSPIPDLAAKFAYEVADAMLKAMAE